MGTLGFILFSFISITETTIPASYAVGEISGAAVTEFENASYLWTIGDSEQAAGLSVSTLNGSPRLIPVEGAQNFDWEALTYDKSRNLLWIVDGGLNNNNRPLLDLYAVEPLPHAQSLPIMHHFKVANPLADKKSSRLLLGFEAAAIQRGMLVLIERSFVAGNFYVVDLRDLSNMQTRRAYLLQNSIKKSNFNKYLHHFMNLSITDAFIFGNELITLSPFGIYKYKISAKDIYETATQVYKVPCNYAESDKLNLEAMAYLNPSKVLLIDEKSKTCLLDFSDNTR